MMKNKIILFILFILSDFFSCTKLIVIEKMSEKISPTSRQALYMLDRAEHATCFSASVQPGLSWNFLYAFFDRNGS